MSNPYAEILANAFEDEMKKIAQSKLAMKASTMKTIGLMGAGAVGAETIHRAETDRRMGKMVRKQQQGY